ncbi:gamma-aminobutyraldehyde dehydrogenase [Siminovitchia acidinfaciens]|uniref:3-sulfolactaldehyde dehydrogenase n=1 Tax=Siminovitchia acidinfaciens TaxID=2321395 RepID=A0A429Y7A0_9BACI|nr:gamma-aminobutyraldehyde dehydrogenase [Siminovitchia acidinfaciens]RST77300.1 gamma-aminobutyraldehyde dehydrogenase [Siminovitchia acidinfaciens]
MTIQTKRQYKIYINGEWTESIEGQYGNVVNPATEEIIADIPLCGEGDVDKAVEAAGNAFKTWKDTTPKERSLVLLKLAEAVEENIDRFALLESKNVGKPVDVAKSDVNGFIDILRFYSGAARNLQGLSTGEYLENHTSMIRREPVGVVASITPWNYPLAMAGWKIGPALAAGNTVVLKPSELTPLTTLLLAEISDGILPPGVLNVVTGYGEIVGAALSKHKKVQMISLTGSVRAGMAVAREAAQTLKKVHLELGGKAPVLIFDDADISKAAAGIKTGAFYNSGQDCTAATRLYVSEKIYDQFIDELVSSVQNINVGDPMEPGVEMGPLVSKAHRERVHGFVERAKKNLNVQVLTGGEELNQRGFYYKPTVITGVKQSDEIVQEEVFGPIITVIPFSNDEEAIEKANDCKYGLAASVWTSSIDRAMNMTKQLDFGAVWTNTHLSIVSEMPHGGSKFSGYGNDQSIYSLEEYTNIKHAMIKFQ